jgi:hypothetical protein
MVAEVRYYGGVRRHDSPPLLPRTTTGEVTALHSSALVTHGSALSGQLY